MAVPPHVSRFVTTKTNRVVIRCPTQRSTEWLTCYGYCLVCEVNKADRPRSRYCKRCLDQHAAGHPPKWGSIVLSLLKYRGQVLCKCGLGISDKNADNEKCTTCKSSSPVLETGELETIEERLT